MQPDHQIYIKKTRQCSRKLFQSFHASVLRPLCKLGRLKRLAELLKNCISHCLNQVRNSQDRPWFDLLIHQLVKKAKLNLNTPLPSPTAPYEPFALCGLAISRPVLFGHMAKHNWNRIFQFGCWRIDGFSSSRRQFRSFCCIQLGRKRLFSRLRSGNNVSKFVFRSLTGKFNLLWFEDAAESHPSVTLYQVLGANAGKAI